MRSQNINLYLTSAHHCGYLPDRLATNLVPDPRLQMNMATYSQLIALGYRRSGHHTYRPHCEGCNACIPCRIPVRHFRMNRSQRRCQCRNDDLDIHFRPARFDDELFELYQRYINTRHGDGDMVNPSPQDYRNFLYSDWSDTGFAEIRLQQRLVSVAVFDRVDDGLSAVYSFFDPDMARRSLGVFNILTLVGHAREQGLSHLYMGYLIHGCRKMQYKTAYRPLQCYLANRWQTQYPARD